MQHLNQALCTMGMILVSVCSSIQTTSVKGGLTYEFMSHNWNSGRQSCGTVGRAPLLTTTNAGWAAVVMKSE
ncbi:hypothetical protein Hanom_Chr06g00493421 [Helianthus anomalus]